MIALNLMTLGCPLGDAAQSSISSGILKMLQSDSEKPFGDTA